MQTGFMAKCKEALMIAKKLKKRWPRLGIKEAWEAFCEARNFKSRIIKKAKRNLYCIKTEVACEFQAQMWKQYK